MGNNVSFKREFGLIVVGSIVFTASFLWKDLLTDIEEMYFPKHYGLAGRVVFTVVVTILLIAFAIHLKNVFGISSNGRRPIKFDDDPIDGNNGRAGMDGGGGMLGMDGMAGMDDGGGMLGMDGGGDMVDGSN